jgi:hypothetical protein
MSRRFAKKSLSLLLALDNIVITAKIKPIITVIVARS